MTTFTEKTARSCAPKNSQAKSRRTTRIPFSVAIEDISPAVAARLLRFNGPNGSGNRTTKPQIIRLYSGAMTRGEWMVTHQGIAIDWFGNLVDGQHRLLAIIDSGATIQMVVTRGVDPNSFRVVDSGAGRTGGDVLTIAGEESGAKLNALARLVVKADTGRALYNSASSRVTNPEIAELLDAQPGVRAFVSRGDSLRAALLLNAAALGAAAYLCERANPGLDTSSWYEGVETGIGLYDGDPRLLLRQTCARIASQRSNGHRTDLVIAYYIRAFNAWVLGEQLSRLMVRNTTNASGRQSVQVPEPVSGYLVAANA